MSLYFSDTLTYRGIVQLYEKEIGVDYGTISNNPTKLKQLTADINLALDDYFALALPASGNWQFDDTNNLDYPIITTNLVAGQQDYTVGTDQDGNLVLDIYKVIVYDAQGNGRELTPVDVTANDRNQDHWNISAFYSGQTRSGTPTRYAKTANGIFLDFVPNYAYTGGLKLYINREPNYFTYTDTVKRPGVPGLHHRYFALKPAVDFARRNGMTNYAQLQAELIKMEGDESKGIIGSIQRYFGRRERDVRKGMAALREYNQ